MHSIGRGGRGLSKIQSIIQEKNVYTKIQIPLKTANNIPLTSSTEMLPAVEIFIFKMKCVKFFSNLYFILTQPQHNKR